MSKKFHNIIISGDVGTGKTTLAAGLSKELDWEHISTGEYFREYIKKQKIPFWDKSKVPDDLERKVDKKFLTKMKNDEHFVFDTHFGGWFARNLTDVLRVLLVCDKNIATKRIVSRKDDHLETPEEIEKRRNGLRKKFQKLYGPDNYEDPKYFQLVIDTNASGKEYSLSQALHAFDDR